MSHPTHRYLTWLALLIALVTIAAVLAMMSPSPRTDAPAGFPQDAPAPTTADVTTAQHGFQYLVSYTTGFSPTTLLVTKGETVRFTNNSDATLQLSLEGAPPLTHGQYFEYAFTDSVTVNDGGAGEVQVTVR